ncbi:hypothetical protein [Ectobacillus antri]|uniref:hypothetical protein n=1 Tax=Ectobacillus antri TaxID=2486280 RepID=UPI000F5B0654|nr:hypothetical protein [Ectobacillus antri]
MKRMILAGVMAISLTGCFGVEEKAKQLEGKVTQIEQEVNGFSERADELSQQAQTFYNEINTFLEAGQKLDQQQIANSLHTMSEEIAQFQKEEIPVLGGELKKLVEDALSEKASLLTEMEEKAKNGTLVPADLQELQNLFKDGIHMNLLEKQ